MLAALPDPGGRCAFMFPIGSRNPSRKEQQALDLLVYVSHRE